MGKTDKKHKNSKTLRQKRTTVACILSAVIPGAGHLYLGLIQKGVSFMLSILLVIEALLYFSATGIQINVPLLILLGLTIPIIYFYNLYDVLQATDRVNERRRTVENEFRNWRKSMVFALILVGEGAVLLILHSRPLWFRQLIELYGRETAAIALVVLGLIFATVQAFGVRKAAKQPPASPSAVSSPTNGAPSSEPEQSPVTEGRRRHES
ncbi:DUF6677 family protein [Saccharibacillus endophyticus]|uniref:Uncharacterized protein n=1 Tax=Saccharibacillus endophyticus TaxID=2060666 RepID=A0ABQ2A8D5_9BACL|nr:DUF6677 family protein [Saccharibacillus endophyticus]GGH87530.1 hypothetical protein GCM10007362_49880 [Saccharibacillus endophyticus]